jgi:hypothetical protein
MAYSLIIPKHLVRDMYLIRKNTKISIRRQIIQAIEFHVYESGEKGYLEGQPDAQNSISTNKD